MRAALALADKAPRARPPSSSGAWPADPDDHEARFDLANALAGHGDLDRRPDHLLQIIEKDRGLERGRGAASSS